MAVSGEKDELLKVELQEDPLNVPQIKESLREPDHSDAFKSSLSENLKVSDQEVRGEESDQDKAQVSRNSSNPANVSLPNQSLEKSENQVSQNIAKLDMPSNLPQQNAPLKTNDQAKQPNLEEIKSGDSTSSYQPLKGSAQQVPLEKSQKIDETSLKQKADSNLEKKKATSQDDMEIEIKDPYIFQDWRKSGTSGSENRGKTDK